MTTGREAAARVVGMEWTGMIVNRIRLLLLFCF